MDWKQQQNGYNGGTPPPPNSPAMADYTAGYNQKNAEAHAARVAATVLPNWSAPAANTSFVVNQSPTPSGYAGGGGGYSGVQAARGTGINGFQILMFILGGPVGFVAGVVPFFIKGLGFYSSYPKEVGVQTGIIGALIFWALSMLTRRGGRYIIGAVTVFALTYLVACIMPAPFIALYRSLLGIH